MNNHGIIVGMLVFSGVALFALVIWKAINEAKYKQDEEWKNVITKARAFSAFTLWILFLCWTAITTFIDVEAIFTFSHVRTIVIVILGIQCAMELMAGIYYQSKMNCKVWKEIAE